jgi:hypothetical protein
MKKFQCNFTNFHLIAFFGLQSDELIARASNYQQDLRQFAAV